jgi:hypothetical protein
MSDKDNVFQFPNSKTGKAALITDIEGFQEAINRFGRHLKNVGRSEGFLIGVIVNGFTSLVIQLVIRALS